jgi:GNAT superfamily N-acetyltransferase
VAQAVRAARRHLGTGHPELRREEVSEAGREVATVTVPEGVVPQGGFETVAARPPQPPGAVARGRAAVPAAGADPWAGLADLWVHPDQRRRGLATAVLGELLGWAAERGATTAFARVPADDAAALACLERLGFTEHHR